MASSYCLSSTRNTSTPQSILLHKAHTYDYCLPRQAPFLTNQNEPIILSKKSPPPRSFNPLLRLKTSKFTYPLASLSSFAEAEDNQESHGYDHQHLEVVEDEPKSDGLQGMAKAFNISSRTASAIVICIAFAALTLPFFMGPMSQAMGLKAKFLAYVTLLFGFYMAWNIGANDVANAMGTSVGSGALTLTQAVMTAAVLEFSGALLMGTHVTNTMQNGILVANVFQGKDMLLFAGLLSSLAAAGTWLQVCLGLLTILHDQKERSLVNEYIHDTGQINRASFVPANANSSDT